VTQSAKILFTVLRIVSGIGLLVYLELSGAISWPALAGLARVWPISLAAGCLWIVIIGLTSWRLCLLLKPRELLIPLSASMRLTFIGAFFTAFLPGGAGGDIVRIFFALKGNEGRRTEIATIFLLDRLFGILGLLILPLLLAPLFPQLLNSITVLRVLLWFAAAAAASILALLLICFAGQANDGSILLRVFQKLPLGTHLKRIYHTVRAYRHNGTTLVVAGAISLLVHSLLVIVLLLLVQATGERGVSWEMAIFIPLGFLANSLPLTPGGVGVGEVAFSKLFQLAGLTGGVEALLGWRVLAVLASLPGLIFYFQGRRQFLAYEAGTICPPKADEPSLRVNSD